VSEQSLRFAGRSDRSSCLTIAVDKRVSWARKHCGQASSPGGPRSALTCPARRGSTSRGAGGSSTRRGTRGRPPRRRPG